jgi:hypothetical protein
MRLLGSTTEEGSYPWNEARRERDKDHQEGWRRERDTESTAFSY